MSEQQTVQRSVWLKLPVQSRIGMIGFGVVLAVVLVITLNPSPVDEGGRLAVSAAIDALYALGLPASFGYAELEFVANIVMFVPLGLLFALCVSGRWGLALAFPPLLSLAIESTQFVLLPNRFADVSDVVANSIGGWIGVGVAALIGLVCNEIWSRLRTSASVTRAPEAISAVS